MLCFDKYVSDRSEEICLIKNFKQIILKIKNERIENENERIEKLKYWSLGKFGLVVYFLVYI